MKKFISGLLIRAAQRLHAPPPDEKIKILAALVLRNDALVKHLAGIVSNLVERAADAGDDFGGRANMLRHDIEQLARRRLAQAKAAYDKATALADELTAKEEQLNKALSDTKSTKEEKDKAVSKLQGEIADIQTQLGIANGVGATTAQAEDQKIRHYGQHDLVNLIVLLTLW